MGTIKTPFVHVVTESGFDLSEYVGYFKFEDCTDQDDILVLTINAATVALVDHPELQEDTVLLFQFGERGGKVSKRYRMMIANLDTAYGSSITHTITATDSGTGMKKADSNKVWEEVTSSDIARKIAEKHGLTPFVATTETKHDSYPQGNMTDFEFLRELASKESGYQFYIKGNVLHFKPIDLSQPSSRTYIWNNGNGEVTGFRPSARSTNKKGASASVEATGTDPMTNEPIKSKAEKKAKGEVPLGDYTVSYNANAEKVSETEAGKRVTSSATRQEDVDAEANNRKKDASMDDLTAALSLDLDPTLQADQIISMANVAQRHAGNWYVHKVVHSGQPGSAATSNADLKRNAANKPTSGSEKTDSANKTSGPEEGSTKRTVPTFYNQNSQEVPPTKAGSSSKVIKLP